MLLKSPLLKIEYNISNIYSSIYITFVNKDKRYDVDRLNLHNFENYIKTEVVNDPQSKQETFEL